MSLARVVLCAVAALLLTAAAPQKKKPLVLTPPEEYPMPPVPPRRPGRLQVAPVPDAEVTAPNTASGDGARLRPDFFPQRIYNGGQGYLSGSTIEGQQEQRQKPIPGFNLKVPLQ